MKSIVLVFLAALVAFPLVAFAQDGPWVITTDYSVFGRVESFAPAAPWTPSGDLALIPGDAVGRHHDGLVYIVGRGGSNLIRIHDPANGFALVREFSLGAGRNPQDIAFDSEGRAFVSCYDEAVLLVVDTEAGVVEQTISTAAYADSDGLPETAWLMVHDNRLYVTCQKLDRGNWYTPSGPGQLLVLDLVTLQWQAPVQLAGANPYTKIRLTDQGRLLVGCAGYWAVLDGGIEVVNPVTNLSEGYLATEQDLGGDLLNFDFTGEGTLHALTNSPANVTKISRFDSADGAIVSLVTSAGYELVDLAWDGGFQLYVADRKTTAPGLRVFDTVSGVELTGSTLSTGLPPFQFILPNDDGISSTPRVVALSGSLNLGLPSPNPCNPASDIEILDSPDQLVRVSVFDLRGHLVQKTELRTDASGRTSYRFTGRDSGGSALATGLYRVVAQSPGGFAARSLTLVK
jgi:FlgD Ig-like domain